MRIITSAFIGVLAGLVTATALADHAEGMARPRQRPRSGASLKDGEAFRKVTDVPGLPRVLIVGDSISIGYTEPVRDLLAAKANVHRIPENGGNTQKGLLRLDTWLGESRWDVIHFNWGLHDIRLEKDGKTGKSGTHVVPIAQYEQNLRAIVERLQKTGAKLIWASTTPVPQDEPKRNPEDVGPYNALAAKVMIERGIPIDDLFAVSTERCANLHSGSGNVHYNLEGSRVLAESVARSIGAVLPDTAQTHSEVR
jgi:acyl-CoA thioesterase-1